jgi:hypothetical protein
MKTLKAATTFGVKAAKALSAFYSFKFFFHKKERRKVLFAFAKYQGHCGYRYNNYDCGYSDV